ncbi:beta-1,6-galactofuranosyltransferase [Fructobacillus tropaeoli]|uniref:beta-1,6-galactofuranosyltransferase n=1 Tax=Fructobacillus tropaeoli TaxID=709323 RepID=UPI0030C8B347
MTNWITQTIEPWMPKGALKAKDDYAKIAQASAFSRLPLERYNDQRFSKAERQKRIEEALKLIVPGDTVVHQFPTYMSADFEAEWLAAIKDKKVNYVLLIHDFEPFRVTKANPTEFTLAQKADLIITHSVAMSQLLAKMGVNQKTIVQPLFDYLGPNPPLASYQKILNYAGTWQKAPWLQDYQGPALKLFGNRPKKWRDWQAPADIKWAGNFEPDDIQNHLDAGFGLLWDSDFDDLHYQSYTKINAPHKASLYLKAGLPLVAWNQSHIGRLINANNLGLTISSLDDLGPALDHVTLDQYQNWQESLISWRDKVTTGGFTQETLAAVQKYFE